MRHLFKVEYFNNSNFYYRKLVLSLFRVFQVVFIEYLARYLRINRPPPFEIEMPERDGTTEDARTTSMCYDLELEEDNGKG